MKLYELLKNAKENPKDFLKNVVSGSDFELVIEKTLSYEKITDIKKIKNWKILKEKTLDKFNPNFVPNNYEISGFMRNPFGSQSYPDFLIFEEDYVYCVEVKTSKSNKPMWNSGIPRQNGIYIISSTSNQAITFFFGKDIITLEEAKKLHRVYVEKFDKESEEFNRNEMKNQKYGIYIYPRKAYAQSKKYNTKAILDFHKNPDKEKLEQKVLDLLIFNSIKVDVNFWI